MLGTKCTQPTDLYSGNSLRYRTCQWSQNALVLPGNKIEFSLETASNYARDQLANKYGFRCLIIGYENPTLVSTGSIPPVVLSINSIRFFSCFLVPVSEFKPNKIGM